MADLRERASRHGVEIEVLRLISDVDKFRQFKRARLMLFPSLFEGFGLPPVEAQYCDLPCIAFDLPVLREVSGEGLTYVAPSDVGQFVSEISRILAGDDNHTHMKDRIASVARFDDFAQRVDRVFREVKSDGPAAISGMGAAARKLALRCRLAAMRTN